MSESWMLTSKSLMSMLQAVSRVWITGGQSLAHANLRFPEMPCRVCTTLLVGLVLQASSRRHRPSQVHGELDQWPL